MKSDKSRKRFVFLCVAPATILFFIFMILPTLNVFRMSLYERGAYSPNETFVGLKNFQHLLKDTQFIRSMQNMILLVVVVTIVTFAFALVFAAILTREKIKGQNFFRIIFYIPNILSVVVISGIFSAIYKPENGMLNSILGLFRDMTDPIQCKGEGDQGDRYHQQDHILHGADELGVLQQVLEILQPHKGLVGRIGTPLIQTHAEHVEGGQDHKEEKQDGSRCHTEEYEPFAAFIRSHRGLTAPFLMVLYSPKKRRR